jgi:ferritin-like metal-binding protein YciE
MPPHIENAGALLLDRLGSLLTVEETLARRVLPQLAREVTDDGLRAALTLHLGETREHVTRLRNAFGALGEPPAGMPAPGLDGLVLEREAKVQEIIPALRSGFDCAAAMGTEHYEINGYEAALTLARALGEDGVVSLLAQTLGEEQSALETLRGHARRLTEGGVEQPTAPL